MVVVVRPIVLDANDFRQLQSHQLKQGVPVFFEPVDVPADNFHLFA